MLILLTERPERAKPGDPLTNLLDGARNGVREAVTDAVHKAIEVLAGDLESFRGELFLGFHLVHCIIEESVKLTASPQCSLPFAQPLRGKIVKHNPSPLGGAGITLARAVPDLHLEIGAGPTVASDPQQHRKSAPRCE
jgi:hypothetical protein